MREEEEEHPSPIELIKKRYYELITLISDLEGEIICDKVDRETAIEKLKKINESIEINKLHLETCVRSNIIKKVHITKLNPCYHN